MVRFVYRTATDLCSRFHCWAPASDRLGLEKTRPTIALSGVSAVRYHISYAIQ